MWAEGYPSININYKNNTTYSLVIINPYKTNNIFTIEINNLKIKHKIKINALSVKRINFFDIIKNKVLVRTILYLWEKKSYNLSN